MSARRDRLETIARQQTTVAGKIRALADAGVPRADIARFLGKRYQHVRNVLEGDAQTRSGQSSGGGEAASAGSGYVLGKADLSGLRDNRGPFEPDDHGAYIDRRSTKAFWIEVKPDGALPLSPEMAEVLAGRPGERVFAEIKEGRVTLMSREAAMQEAQAIVAKHIKPGRLASEELIEDRRSGKLWGD